MLTFLDVEEFTMTTAVMRRGDVETHTVYVVAGAQHVIVARASGNTAAEAMNNLLKVTSTQEDIRRSSKKQEKISRA
jgi:hypothetical protein